jgi:hypothetical protein
MEAESRLDKAIRRKELLANEVEKLWTELWLAMQQTAQKLAKHFGEDLELKIDHNTAISVNTRPRQAKDMFTKISPALRVFFDRSSHKVSVSRSDHPESGYWDAEEIQIDVRADGGALCFVKQGKELGPYELAESLLAEKLCGLKI